MMAVRFCLFCLLVCFATTALGEDISGSWVRLRVLDKIAAKPQTLDIRIGESKRVLALHIHPRACFKRPPEDVPDVAVWLEVHDFGKILSDQQQEDDESVLVFRGWMFLSAPSLSSLTHPVYDLWVVDCFEDEPS